MYAGANGPAFLIRIIFKKMTLSRLITLAFCGFCIHACTSNPEKPKVLELVKSDKKVTLALDNKTSNISDGLQYFPDSKLLFNLNWMENSIQIYDLTTETKIKELKFDYEGPNGVLDIMGIFVHRLDSIFLFNQLVPQMTMIDTTGRIKSIIHYQAPDKYSPAFIHNAYFMSKPSLEGSRMVTKTHFYGPLQNMTQDELQSKELMYEIDLKTGKTWFLDLKFPKDYMPGGLKLFEASITKGAGKTVYSLFGDHRLFYVSNFGDSLLSKNGKSVYLPESLPLFPLTGDGLDFRKYSFYSPHYESLDYDPFREVFIRFAFHPFEQNESIPVSDWRNHSGPFSIQVFDKELNLLSEKAFEANRYHPFDYFISPDGIYISTGHPLNPENSEDAFSFELFVYQERKNQ
jgi:hypothetical protein